MQVETEKRLKRKECVKDDGKRWVRVRNDKEERLGERKRVRVRDSTRGEDWVRAKVTVKVRI